MRNTTLYNQAGTITFRRGSSSILLDFVEKIKCGTNLQNIEKSARRMYHARAGYKLAQVDQSGAEALIVAMLTRHGKFRDLFLNSVKPHVFVGLHLFFEVWQHKINEGSLDIKIDLKPLLDTSIPELHNFNHWKQVDSLIKSSDNWPAHERYYYISKQVCHSSNYGIRPNTFALNTLEKSKGRIVLSKEQCEKYLAFYHSLFPEIQEFHREIQRQIESTRTLYNLFGYPRYFSGEISESSLKEAYAFIPQSTVGCITAKAFTKLQKFIEEQNLRWDLLADTHDSYLIQAPEDEIMDCAKIAKTFMEQDLISPRGEPFKMKAEVAVGFNWSPYNEKYNIDGLKEIKV